MAKVTLTENRVKVVDHSYPYLIDSITFTSPLPTLYGYTNLLEPFDNHIWICIMSSILTIITVKYFIFGRLDFSPFRTLFGQPIAREKTNSFGDRLLLFNWLIMSVILTSSYAGCVYSLISVPKKLKIETLNSLIDGQNSGLVRAIIYSQAAIYYNLFKV